MTTLILSVFFSISASAYDVELDGIYYNLIKETKTAEVTCRYGNDYSGEIIIPESITFKDTEFSVSGIGEYAFNYCSNLTSVTIPNSVTSIGSCAFSDCSNLISVTIPNSVTSIGSYAFLACSNLISVIIPNSVTSIGDCVFHRCTSLTSITIPNSVTSIESGTFNLCTSLTSITIPSSVTIIGDDAFLSCTSLTSITIPNSVTRIGFSAFEDCTSLTSITIPNSVLFIGINAFSGCNGLENVYCYAENIPFTWLNAFSETNIYLATLHVPASAIDAYKTTEPWSNFGTIKAIEGTEGIESVKARGIAIQSAGGFINISGLDTNEKVDFYATDGKTLGSAKSIDGSASFSSKQGTIVVAKIGKESVKIAVE